MDQDYMQHVAPPLFLMGFFLFLIVGILILLYTTPGTTNTQADQSPITISEAQTRE